ncbi:MAG TPA: YggT family protein [Pyrinomonadaceae bacterium]|nr:YggT family protein [Pyrinomonadaceae bacterium]
MVDNKLALEEAQRAANFEAIKSNVKADVGRDIYAEASRPVSTSQIAQVEDVADSMRRNVVNEVVETEHEVKRARVMARISQIVDYVFFLIYGLLTIRLLLELFAARETAGFFQFIKTITDPFYSPFRGLVPSPSTAEGFTLALPVIVAIVVYMLLHLAINGLLRIFAHRKTAV